MKLASFKRSDGQSSYGNILRHNETLVVTDLGEKLSQYPTLRTLLAEPCWQQVVESMSGSTNVHALDDVTLLPTIPDPEKILCVGINYASHVVETGRVMPSQPMIFTRFANTQVGHNVPMVKPLISEKFDFEGELAVIIGKPGRYISKEMAFDHVAGYSCYNDGSIRDWQRHSSQFTPGKNFPQTGAFGPWLVSPDEAGEVRNMTLTTSLNGEIMQHATLNDLIFDIPALISYCSSFTALSPGDVIITGTPGGVGAFRTPPIWMSEGDEVSVQIDGIGMLTNRIIDEGSASA